MVWIQLVTLLAVIQFFVFGTQVGRARGRYNVPVPATTGNEMFERYNRVHMNTLEILVIFLPGLWLAAQYWSPQWMAGLGAVYLIGRIVYFRSYIADPKKRGPGFALSMLPTSLLVLAALVGVVRSLLAG